MFGSGCRPQRLTPPPLYPKAVQQPDATGALPLHIAATMGASGAVKDMLVSAWPEAAEKGTLAEALKGNWGVEAVRRIVALAPQEVSGIRAPLCFLYTNRVTH